jgi:hypothetical protein
MHNDGRTYIWLPSGLTLNKLTTETAAIVNAVHTAIGAPLVTAGQTNPYYLDLNDLDMGGAPFTRDAEPGMACCGPIENLAYMALDYVSLIVAFGGQVEGMPVFFELDDIEAECPFSDSNETWETWGIFGESHKPVQLGDKWYRSSNVGESGAVLLASQWVPYRQAGGVVLTVAEYQAVQAANQTLPG